MALQIIIIFQPGFSMQNTLLEHYFVCLASVYKLGYLHTIYTIELFTHTTVL
jgi:hypothetical protein